MDPFIGQVMMFGGNFAPRGWAFCEGQLLAISSHSALFSILGTIYGGDGRTSFALPDLRGRTAIQPGTGPGLTSHNLGQRGGYETITHTVAQLPSHTHDGELKVDTGAGDESNPDQQFLAGASIFAEEKTPNAFLPGVTVGMTGQQRSVNNIQPFTAVYYIIALVGTYPSRN